MNKSLYTVANVILVLVHATHAQELDKVGTTDLLASRSNVGRVYCTANSAKYPGSGFLVQLEKDQRYIITAAHNSPFGSKAVFTYWPYGQSDPVVCRCVAVDQRRDLMVLKPPDDIGAPGFELPPNDFTYSPKVLTNVWLLGSHGGYKTAVQPGEITSEAETAREMMDDLHQNGRNADLEVALDTLIIRHSAVSAEGCSGAPLLDSEGRLVAVQLGQLLDVKGNSIPGQYFAVSSKHLAELDLSQPLPVGPPPAPARDSVVAKQSGSSVMIDGTEILPVCTIHRELPTSYDSLLKYFFLRDKDEFRRQVSQQQLQPLLVRREVAYVRNDAFGFSFLTPRGYGLKTITSKNWQGVCVELNDGEVATILAVFADNYRQAGESIALQRILDFGFDETADNRPARYEHYFILAANHVFEQALTDLFGRIVRAPPEVVLREFVPTSRLIEGDEFRIEGVLQFGEDTHHLAIFCSRGVAALVHFVDDGIQRHELARRIILGSFALD